MAYSKAEFRGPSFSAKELSRRWDGAVDRCGYFKLEQATVSDRHYQRVIRNLLSRWMPNPQGLRALKLDLFNEATGTAHSRYFLEKKARLFGIDISFKITEQAHRKGEGAFRVLQGDVRTLPLQAESVDLIFSLGTLEHVQEPDQPKVVKELFRVLRPGGICLVGVNNRHSLWGTPLLFEFLERTGWIRDQWSYEPTYPPGHLKALLQRVGFESVRIDGVILFPKWLRLYDMWSASRNGRFFLWSNRLKELLYLPITQGFEWLESRKILNYFAEATTTVGVKPLNHKGV